MNCLSIFVLGKCGCYYYTGREETLIAFSISLSHPHFYLEISDQIVRMESCFRFQSTISTKFCNLNPILLDLISELLSYRGFP